MRGPGARRALLVLGAALLLVLAALDLARRDSFLRRAWAGERDPATPAERMIDQVRGGLDRPLR